MIDSGTIKGIQTPGQALAVQDYKDGGRVTIAITLDNVATAAVAETVATIGQVRSNGNAGAMGITTPTSVSITSGKKLRFQSYAYTVENGGTVPVASRVKVRIRAALGGAATVASPLQHLVVLGVASTAKATATLSGDFPDGMEFDGITTPVAWCVTVESPDFVTTTQVPVIHAVITAYEF